MAGIAEKSRAEILKAILIIRMLKFKDDVKKVIIDNNLIRKNVHIMDETGLYSDSIPTLHLDISRRQASLCLL
ncbi:hypothetical protein M9Y10_010705 [Tritrichomonas musculus]|uniref:Transposase n=1 Tax=Tritrichomonas musculus TaxID=1915356 RepID=A0ABR2ILP4_9EUKA